MTETTSTEGRVIGPWLHPNKTNIRKWVNTLRSGRYEQGMGLLYNVYQGRYCAVGVACSLARAEGNDVEFINRSRPNPAVLNSWLGLDDEVIRHYSGLNDSGMSFDA